MLPCLRLLTPRTSHVWKLDRYPASVTLTPYSGWEGKWLPQHQLICPDCFTSLMTSWTPPREKPREDFTMPNFSQNNKTEGHRVSADSFAAYAKEVEVRARSLDAVYQEATERFNIGVETLRRTKLPPNIRVCADEVSFPESTKLSLSMPLTDYPQRLRLLDGNRVLADLPFPVIPAEEETFEFDYQFSGFTLTIEGTISDGHLKFRQKLRPDSSWLGKVYDWSGWKLPFTAWPVTAALVLTLFTAGILLVPQFASIRRVGMEPNLNQTLGAGAKEIISGSILSLRTFVIDMKLPSNSIGLQNSWEIYDQGGLVRQGECGGVPATCSIPFSPLDRWRHRDVQISVTIPNGRRSDNLVRFD